MAGSTLIDDPAHPGGTLIDGLGGDAGFGEASVERNDDGYSEFIDFTAVFEDGLSFFGAEFTGLYVNTNGNITFAQPLATFTPFAITAGSTAGLFALFADVDTRSGPTATSPGGNSTGSNLVWYDVDAALDRVTITWDDVGYYSEGVDRTSAFQIILEDASAQDGRAAGDFNIMFRYENVNWTTGDASGGEGGLGGTVARAGWTAGVDAAFFELPQSGDQAGMLALESTPGNLGVPGVWWWEVSGGEIPVAVSVSAPATIVEGDAGVQTLDFTITRFGDQSETLEVDWLMRGDTGTGRALGSADVDGALPRNGTVTFDPGVASITVSVDVLGDTTVELDEVLEMRLVAARNLTNDDPVSIARARATVEVLNDDGLPPPPPPVIARFWGDPHLTTLDGLGYDFQAVGEFVLVQGTDDNLQVHVRTEALTDAVSVITQLGTKLGNRRVTLDLERDDPLWIDGAASGLREGDGSLEVGPGRIYLNDGVYTIVYGSGEQLKVSLFETNLNVQVFLNDTRAAGSVEGLLGNLDGDASNDLQVDGVALLLPVDFDLLYGDFADEWRVTNRTSLLDYGEGEGTRDYTDRAFPGVAVTIDDLPEELVTWATEQAQAAGITDPAALNAAILDFALTGDLNFVSASAGLSAAPTTAATAPTDAPSLGTTLLLTRTGNDPSEGDEGSILVDFTVTRGGDATGELTVTYTVSGTADLLSGDGSVVFADGETSKTIQVEVASDTVAELDETLTVRIATAAPGVSVLAAQRSATILNDDGDVGSIFAMAADRTALNEGDRGVRDATFTVTRTGDTAEAASVRYEILTGTGKVAKSDIDGKKLTGRVDFDADEAERTLTIGVTGDTLAEANEKLVVRLTSANGGVLGEEVRGQTLVRDDDGRGGKKADKLAGDGTDNKLAGLGGNDRLAGNGGDDRLDGGSGKDVLKGGSGNDRLLGGSGNDRLEGGGGDDRLDGGGGNDLLIAGGGRDRIEFGKGDGRDTVKGYDDRQDKFVIDIKGMTFRDLDIDQHRKHAVVDYGKGEVTILKFDADDLDRGDFLFG